jgi:hypothetical protein
LAPDAPLVVITSCVVKAGTVKVWVPPEYPKVWVVVMLAAAAIDGSGI